jgi:hypothetical protein
MWWDLFFNFFPNESLFISMKTISQECCICQQKFEMEMKYYKRNLKNNVKSCCSRKCGGILVGHTMKNNPTLNEHNRYDIVKHANNKLDIYSPFRIFLNVCRTRSKKNNSYCDLDIEYLLNLWKSQNERCPYTGLVMILPSSTTSFSKDKSLKKVSLDRIDSSKGYIKGNVEFVTQFINLAKNNYSKTDVVNIINEIKNGGSVG